MSSGSAAVFFLSGWTCGTNCRDVSVAELHYCSEEDFAEFDLALGLVALLTVTDTDTPVCLGQASGVRAYSVEKYVLLSTVLHVTVASKRTRVDQFQRLWILVVIVERYVSFNAVRHVAVVLRRTCCCPQSGWKVARVSWSQKLHHRTRVFTTPHAARRDPRACSVLLFVHSFTASSPGVLLQTHVSPTGYFTNHEYFGNDDHTTEEEDRRRRRTRVAPTV